jgi:hypothetical protein
MRNEKLALFWRATFVQRQWFEQKLCLPPFANPQARAPTVVSALAIFETHERSNCDMFSLNRDRDLTKVASNGGSRQTPVTELVALRD